MENVDRQAAAACCVSESTVKCCTLDTKPPKETRPVETVVKFQLRRPRITAAELTCFAIRTSVHSFYHTMKRASKCEHKKKPDGEADY